MVHLGLPQREIHLIETVTRLVDQPMLILQGYHLTHHQEDPTQMMAIQQGLSYRDGRPREYDHVPGSKRPYEMGGLSSQYVDAYTDRLGRSNIGYGSSMGSMSGQDSHGLYSSHQGMPYSGGKQSLFRNLRNRMGASQETGRRAVSLPMLLCHAQEYKLGEKSAPCILLDFSC